MLSVLQGCTYNRLMDYESIMGLNFMIDYSFMILVT